MITRNVNGIEFDILPEKGNEIFFFPEFYENCPSSGINDILIAIYEEKGEYTPESLFIELTGKCNFNCPFCYIHNCSDAKNQPFIPFEQIKKDIDYLVDNGLITCTISGGECLLHPEFNRIYEYIKNKGVLVTVLSNLSLLAEETFNLFKRLPPYKVDVTIYGMDDESMFRATGQGKFSSDTVLNNIILLKNNGINVSCKTPYNSITKDQIPKIEVWCRENEIPYFYSMETFDTYDGTSMQAFSMPQKDVYKDKITAKQKKNPIQTFDRKINFRCKGGEYGLFISYDYKLRPCMPFYSIAEANFDILSLGLENALSQMKAFISRYKGTPLNCCDGCEYCNACDLCIITQLSNRNINDIKQQHCSLMQSICME